MEAIDTPAIGPAPPDRAEEALLLVFSELSPQDRTATVEVFLRAARRGTLSLDGLIEARRRGELVGAAFSQVEVGRTAVVWPPRLVPGEPMATSEALLAATVKRLAGESICAAHALLPKMTPADEEVLQRAGFLPLASLLYLASRREVFPSAEPPGPLEFEPYTPANHDRLAAVIEATYAETLDCPQLGDVRNIEDVLAGYRATGEFSPERWLIVRHAASDVGCLLLADHPEQDNFELVYMGLVVSARGHAWGTQIARHAQWLAWAAGRARLVLAVDASNEPAVRAYAAAGFEAWERREVYLKQFESPR